jgi:small multidrug resistance pump
MHWLFLVGAIIMEVAGTTCIKLSEGFTRLWPSILIFVFYALSFTLVTFAVKKLELSITYAIWSGVGTLLIAAIGLLWFKEPMSVLKAGSMLLVIAGVVGLNLSQPGDSLFRFEQLCRLLARVAQWQRNRLVIGRLAGSTPLSGLGS